MYKIRRHNIATKRNMKKLFAVIFVIIIFSGCYQRLTVKRHIDDVTREDIDMNRFNKFVRNYVDARKDSDNYSFKRAGQTIRYHRSAYQESYRFEIETNRYRESFDVEKVKGDIKVITRK